MKTYKEAKTHTKTMQIEIESVIEFFPFFYFVEFILFFDWEFQYFTTHLKCLLFYSNYLLFYFIFFSQTKLFAFYIRKS